MKYFQWVDKKVQRRPYPWATIFCNKNGVNDTLKFKKVRHKGIEDFMKSALIFLFFYLAKIEGFFITEYETSEKI